MTGQIVLRVSALGLILVVAMGGCGPSAPPRSDEAKIVTEALRHAVVDQKDIPGYQNLPDRDTLVVLDEFLFRIGNLRLTARDLPRTDEVVFLLVPLGDIFAFTNLHGPKGVLFPGWPEVAGDSATVFLSLSIARWIGSNRASPGRADWTSETLGYYTLEFRRDNGVWQFARVLPEEEVIRTHASRHNR